MNGREQSMVVDSNEDRVDAALEQRILLERAKSLAQATSLLSASSDSDGVEHVVFQLGALRYAIPLDTVKEVLPAKGITPLPSVPPFIAGIMNVRGQIVSVTALIKLFEPGAELTIKPGARILMVRAAGLTAGLLVDEIDDVARIRSDTLKSGLATAVGTYERHILGITTDLINVLAIDALFREPSLVVGGE